jgi:hypothetical protein
MLRLDVEQGERHFIELICHRSGRLRYSRLLANPDRREFQDLSVAGDRSALVRGRVFPDRVLAALPHELAVMEKEVVE